MADGGAQKTERCICCGGTYLLAFFRHTNKKASRSINLARTYHDRCIGCEASSKREEQEIQRLRRKAKIAMRRHGIKLQELGVIKDYDDLAKLYGWSPDRMVEDIKRVIKEGCSYCLQPVGIGAQGLGGVTLDILDPRYPPHYSTNIQWCCARCNSEKQRTSPDVWGARRSMWKLWRENRDRIEDNPEAFGFLPFRNGAEPPPTLW
jgi:hypothetical protein